MGNEFFDVAAYTTDPCHHTDTTGNEEEDDQLKGSAVDLLVTSNRPQEADEQRHGYPERDTAQGKEREITPDPILDQLSSTLGGQLLGSLSNGHTVCSKERETWEGSKSIR
jgi:hypothetical protein